MGQLEKTFTHNVPIDYSNINKSDNWKNIVKQCKDLALNAFKQNSYLKNYYESYIHSPILYQFNAEYNYDKISDKLTQKSFKCEELNISKEFTDEIPITLLENTYTDKLNNIYEYDFRNRYFFLELPVSFSFYKVDILYKNEKIKTIYQTKNENEKIIYKDLNNNFTNDILFYPSSMLITLDSYYIKSNKSYKDDKNVFSLIFYKEKIDYVDNIKINKVSFNAKNNLFKILNIKDNQELIIFTYYRNLKNNYNKTFKNIPISNKNIFISIVYNNKTFYINSDQIYCIGPGIFGIKYDSIYDNNLKVNMKSLNSNNFQSIDIYFDSEINLKEKNDMFISSYELLIENLYLKYNKLTNTDEKNQLIRDLYSNYKNIFSKNNNYKEFKDIISHPNFETISEFILYDEIYYKELYKFFPSSIYKNKTFILEKNSYLDNIIDLFNEYIEELYNINVYINGNKLPDCYKCTIKNKESKDYKDFKYYIEETFTLTNEDKIYVYFEFINKSTNKVFFYPFYYPLQLINEEGNLEEKDSLEDIVIPIDSLFSKNKFNENNFYISYKNYDSDYFIPLEKNIDYTVSDNKIIIKKNSYINIMNETEEIKIKPHKETLLSIVYDDSFSYYSFINDKIENYEESEERESKFLLKHLVLNIDTDINKFSKSYQSFNNNLSNNYFTRIFINGNLLSYEEDYNIFSPRNKFKYDSPKILIKRSPLYGTINKHECFIEFINNDRPYCCINGSHNIIQNIELNKYNKNNFICLDNDFISDFDYNEYNCEFYSNRRRISGDSICSDIKDKLYICDIRNFNSDLILIRNFSFLDNDYKDLMKDEIDSLNLKNLSANLIISQNLSINKKEYLNLYFNNLIIKDYNYDSYNYLDKIRFEDNTISKSVCNLTYFDYPETEYFLYYLREDYNLFNCITRGDNTYIQVDGNFNYADLDIQNNRLINNEYTSLDQFVNLFKYIPIKTGSIRGYHLFSYNK